MCVCVCRTYHLTTCRTLTIFILWVGLPTWKISIHLFDTKS